MTPAFWGATLSFKKMLILAYRNRNVSINRNSIFLRLTAELAGKYALIVIFVCLCVGVWGILAGVYILAVKEWVFHLGLAFRRSCFGDGESRAD